MSEQLNLDEIRARCERATPGPWYPRATDDASFMNARYVSTEQGPMMTCKDGLVWVHDGLRGMAEGQCDYKSVVCITLLQEPRLAAHASDGCDEDAEFIAHARTDISALLALVDRLTARVGELEAERQPISVGDGIPQAGARVLVKMRKGAWCCACWTPAPTRGSVSKWEEVGGDRYWLEPGVTHWMPAPPEVAP